MLEQLELADALLLPLVGLEAVELAALRVQHVLVLLARLHLDRLEVHDRCEVHLRLVVLRVGRSACRRCFLLIIATATAASSSSATWRCKCACRWCCFEDVLAKETWLECSGSLFSSKFNF